MTHTIHHHLPRSVVGAVLAALLVGCTDKNNEWFPLQAGRTQIYDVRFDTDEPQAPGTWAISTEGPRPWRDKNVLTRWHSAGVRYLFISDEHGVRRVAHQTELDDDPVADESPIWVLKAPYTVGTEWTSSTVPHLLARRNEHPRELKHSHRATMHWRIEADKETVILNNGRSLSPCLKVVGTARLNLYTDPVNGFTDVPLISREWYCKGHGLVRLEREERVPQGFMVGGLLVAQWRP